jgi:fructose-1,6-bisphosphatase/inositol monophosphatase family enzyme
MTTRDDDRYRKRLDRITAYFLARPAFAGVPPLLAAFGRDRSLKTATALLKEYFSAHQAGDVESLRMITATFGHKSVVLRIVDDILSDPKTLEEIAARSYPHPIGFDKLVLFHDKATGFKFRLHIYWRSPQDVKTELIHLHKFEMASSPVTGELDNNLYRVLAVEGPRSIPVQPHSGGATQTFWAYTGYERDADGSLHKRFMGKVELEDLGRTTFVPGQTYAQGVRDGHYVATNAETGYVNNDVCSTIYIHGPALDDDGRKIPILFEPARLPEDDRVIPVIASFSAGRLRASLARYREILHESVRFYEWVYDPKHGPNLSIGLIAGYLLAEAFGHQEVLRVWEENETACRRLLGFYATGLAEILRGVDEGLVDIEDLDATDHETRYIQQLIYKAGRHAEGRSDWLATYGDLAAQFRRYRDALIDDYAVGKGMRTLKPVWGMQTLNVRGGVHWGNVRALLHATRSVESMLRSAHENGALEIEDHDDAGLTTKWDREVQKVMQAELAKDFPDVAFEGEEGRSKLVVIPPEGSRRWLVDPIDATRNFIGGSRNFAVSSAHQTFDGEEWRTTDAVVSLPAHEDIYWAEAGEGAYLIRKGVQRKLKPVSEADERRPSWQSLVELPTVRGFGTKEGRFREALSARTRAGQRSTGCTALSLCQLAAGEVQAVIVTANDYDVAAGILIAEAVGAHVAKHLYREGVWKCDVYVVSRSKRLLDDLNGVIRLISA